MKIRAIISATTAGGLAVGRKIVTRTKPTNKTQVPIFWIFGLSNRMKAQSSVSYTLRCGIGNVKLGVLISIACSTTLSSGRG